MAGDSNIRYWLRSRGIDADEALVQVIREAAKATSRLLENSEVQQIVDDWRQQAPAAR
jgi:hypothetical protein